MKNLLARRPCNQKTGRCIVEGEETSIYTGNGFMCPEDYKRLPVFRSRVRCMCVRVFESILLVPRRRRLRQPRIHISRSCGIPN